MFSQFCYPLLLLHLLLTLTNFAAPSFALDPVYVRSNSFGQLVTSSTLRWVRGQDPHAVSLESGQIICRVSQSGLRQIGLLSQNSEECSFVNEEGMASSPNYQTLAGQAAKLSWVSWVRPNPPPAKAVAFSENQQKFIATPTDDLYVVGYLDPRQSLGSAIFPHHSIPLSTSARVLTEVEPERYEIYGIEFKKSRDFAEEEVVLARGKLKYQTSEDGYDMEYLDENLIDEEEEEELEYSSANQRQHYHHTHDNGDKGRIESVLSYEIACKDFWGNGNLMAKELPTFIQLPNGWSPGTKTIKWGLASERPRSTETMAISADLLKETGVSVAIKGTKMDGEMSYWATLRTFYKDGSSATRFIEGVRRLKEVNNVHVVLGRPYFLQNGTLVPEPTTTTTTTTPRPTSSSSSSEASSSARGERDKGGGREMLGDSDNTITRADKSTSSQAVSKYSSIFNYSYTSYYSYFVTLSFLFSFVTS